MKKLIIEVVLPDDTHSESVLERAQNLQPEIEFWLASTDIEMRIEDVDTQP